MSIVTEDALSFVDRAIAVGNSYDFVVHDVFSDGAEAISLFSARFLDQLANILKPDGSIVIVSTVALLCEVGQRQKLTCKTELRRKRQLPPDRHGATHDCNSV